MKLYELLTDLGEARRNPEKNLRTDGHQAAVNYLRNKGRDIRKYGVSMTELPKLGINPGSTYKTPVGIYFYPAEYYVRIKGPGKQLEFKDEAPYIQVFELLGNFEYIDELDSNKFREYVKILYKNAGKIGTYINMPEKETTQLLGEIILNGNADAKNNSYGGHLWYIFYALGYYVGRNKRDHAAPRSSVIWNAICRMLGIDGFIDNGEGIIHQNEPTSGVVFDTRSIRHDATFTNNISTSGNMIKDYIYLANTADYTDYNYINLVDYYVRDKNLRYNPLYKNYCNKIISNLLLNLRNYPARYNNIVISGIKNILKLTKDTSVAKEMIVGYYVNNFPKIKKETELTIKYREDELAEFKNSKNGDKNKLLLRYAMYVPESDIKMIKKTIENLKPYKSDPNAREIINYLSNALSRLKFNV